MTVSVRDFLTEVERIARNPGLTYRTGGTGRDGTCDCIGLIMGAMYALGTPRYGMHSTNYFAREQMQSLVLVSEAVLAPGMLLYKARADTGDLRDYYKDPGGRYYNGDLRDYYHVGVVTSTEPLQITHCTSGGGVDGIKIDTSPKGWTHAGLLKGVDYSGSDEDDVEATESMVYEAIVATTDGMPLKLRARPSADEKLYWKILNGSRVTVLESAQGWATVKWSGRRGYCMSQYLIPAGVQGVSVESGCDAGTFPSGGRTNMYEILTEMNGKLDAILERLEGGDANG